MSGGTIAICQYGGRFNTDNGGSMSYSGGEAHAIDIDRSSCFKDLKSEIASVFNIDVSNVAIKYFLPNNNRTLITISCDRDLQRMIDFYANSGCTDIYILNSAESRATLGCHGGSIISDAPTGKRYNVSGCQKRIPARRPGGRNVRSKISQENSAALGVPALSEPHTAIIQSQHASGMTEICNPGLTVMDALQYVPPPAFSDDIITRVGQEFDNVKDFRDRLCEYAISKGFVYRYVKNESVRVTARCNAENCPWRIHASQTPRRKKFVIKKLIDVHTCGGGRITSESQVRITKKWLVNVIREKLIENPDSKPKEMAEEIYRDYGVNVSYFQVWHGKNDAEKELYKMHVEACDLLPWFCEKILESNPGTVVTLATSSDSRYRVFVSFHACRAGFERGCRPLIFLDRIPLKKNNHVKLLVAAAVDGDDGIFPVAFAAVEAEIYDSWFWFLEQLKGAVTTSHITFVSNTRNGLDEAVRQVFEDSFHGYSVLHLVDDFRAELNKGSWAQDVKDAMIKNLECAAEAFLLEDFNAHIEGIRKISSDAANWVIASKPEHWSNALFRGFRYNHFSANIVEFFDWIPVRKESSVALIIDSLCSKLIETIAARREASNAWEDCFLTPTMEQKLKKETSISQKLEVVFSSDTVFEVRGKMVNVVNMGNNECTCRRWEITGLPCAHAIAVLERLGKSAYDYCSDYFKVDFYLATYSEAVNPIPEVHRVTSVFGINLYPPSSRDNKWQKKKPNVRKPDTRALHCSRCKGAGHNKKTCDAHALF